MIAPVLLDPPTAWTARDAVLAQLERYRPRARADARYQVTVARLEAALAALDAALEGNRT